MATYNLYRYWSITHGMQVARIAMRNEKHDELFVIVPQEGTGMQKRAWRTKGLEALEAAIATHHEPGPIHLEEAA